MAWIDLFLLAFVAMGLIRGLRNGFFFELAGLFTLLFGVYLAIKFSFVANHFLAHELSWNPKVIQITAFVITLVIVLVGASLLAKFFTTLARVAHLGALNKLGGGIVGTLKMIVVLSLAISLFNKLNFSHYFVSQQTIEKSGLYLPIQQVATTLYPDIKAVFAAYGPTELNPN